MIRRLAIEELKRGMFVVDTRVGKPLCPPLYSVEGFILASSEAKILRSKGFTEVFVDEARFCDCPEQLTAAQLPASPRVEPEQSQETLQTGVDFADECERAKIIYNTCINTAISVHEQVQATKAIDFASTEPMFADMVDSLSRNPSALLSISKLRARDAYTYSHCVNVAIYSTLLGRRLGVRVTDLSELTMAAFFHDIGKLFMPLQLLNFPGRLSGNQLEIIRRHASLGLTFLEEHLGMPRAACLAALDHHERHDGSGYPMGKSGESISFIGQVVAVADVYDALCSRRPYKEPMHPMESLSLMYRNREKDFAPGFLEGFIEVMGVYPTGCLVQLSNHFTAVVTEQNSGNPIRPKVVLLSTPFGVPMTNPRLVDLTVHITLSIAKPLPALPCTVDVEECIRYAC